MLGKLTMKLESITDTYLGYYCMSNIAMPWWTYSQFSVVVDLGKNLSRLVIRVGIAALDLSYAVLENALTPWSRSSVSVLQPFSTQVYHLVMELRTDSRSGISFDPQLSVLWQADVGDKACSEVRIIPSR